MATSRLALALSALVASPCLAADLNENGLCDVWEARFHATELAPDADTDGDGTSNREEAEAGTDPFSRASRHQATLGELTDTQAPLEVPATPGKAYQLLRAESLEGPWLPVGPAVPATDPDLVLNAPRGGDTAFFRVEVHDLDSDEDGLSDWAERQLGFDPQSADSFGSGSPGADLAAATGVLAQLSSGDVTLQIDAADAFEKNLSPARVTFSRPTAAAWPLPVFLKPSGTDEPAKSSASPADYEFVTADSQPVGNALYIPPGATSVTLHVRPRFDSKPEVPETLRLKVGGSSLTADLRICDAAPTPENQRLLVAYLRPKAGTRSLGGGLAALRLQGDNDSATVSVSFSNLNSPVNSTQVQTIDAAILQSVPPFAYNGQLWPIRASQAFTTDQQVLDALLSANVELTVFTETHVAGEIAGAFTATAGSTDFVPPPPPPTLAQLADFDLERDIARFLSQATFGPSPDGIADMKSRVASHNGDRLAAYAEWIDEQFALNSPSLLAYTMAADREEIEVSAALPEGNANRNTNFDPNHNNRRRGWWLLARHAPDQLRQRAAFALSQIFIVSEKDALLRERSYGMSAYYDMLRTGASGSFADLLRNVSTHPVMGHYLSHLRNGKATFDSNGNILISPDENFAREIMQLFSIGLVQLHPDGSLKLGPDGQPIPTYDQDDITELARVFTGWSFSVRNNPSSSNNVVENTSFTHGNGSERFESQWMAPMKNFPDRHDTGAKSVMDLEIPAGQSGDEDLDDVIAYLSSHPNTAPFISRRLIQRLVTANPSGGYLHRVATVFQNSGGNLAATIKAILLDPEARSLQNSTTIASTGKVSEPLVRFLSFLRAFDVKSQLQLSDLTAYGYSEVSKFPAGTTRVRMQDTDTPLSQTPMAAPSVFNWFLPDYSPAGLLATNGLVSPELQLANENSVYFAINQHNSIIYTSTGLSVSALRDQGVGTSPYDANSDNLIADVTPLEDLYMAVMDENGDGQITSADTNTFNKPAKVREACAAVLDRIDLLLCAGALKAQYGDTPGQPRAIILDTLAAIRASSDSSGTASNHLTSRRDRIRAALWLVVSTPDSLVQK